MDDEPHASNEDADPGDGPDHPRAESAPGRQAPRVARRPRGSLSAEEQAFLERYRRDMPPHHDSSWG